MVSGQPNLLHGDDQHVQPCDGSQTLSSTPTPAMSTQEATPPQAPTPSPGQTTNTNNESEPSGVSRLGVGTSLLSNDVVDVRMVSVKWNAYTAAQFSNVQQAQLSDVSQSFGLARCCDDAQLHDNDADVDDTRRPTARLGPWKESGFCQRFEETGNAVVDVRKRKVSTKSNVPHGDSQQAQPSDDSLSLHDNDVDLQQTLIILERAHAEREAK